MNNIKTTNLFHIFHEHTLGRKVQNMALYGKSPGFSTDLR